MSGSDRWRTLRCGAVALVLAALVGAGCGPEDKRLNVTGVVTLDGKPFEHGRIQFYGPNNQFSTAGISPDGTFIATDVIPGELRVAVVTPGGLVTLPPPDEKGLPVKKAGGEKARAVPTKYQNADTSGLVFNITPSSAHIEVRMISH